MTTSAPPSGTGPDPATPSTASAVSTIEQPTDGAPPGSDGESTSGRRGFFGWMRSIDLPRTSGWVGGVCAGVAARLGIDPLIVRGVVVVIAVLGGPMLLLYAAAWFLLPDEHDRIHAQELVRGRLGRAHAGIIALVLASFLPLTQGFWYLGSTYWGTPQFGASIARALWTAVVLVVLAIAVVWVARRAARTRPDAADGVGDTAGAAPDAGGGPASAVSDSAPAGAAVPTDAASTPAFAAESPPPEPPPGSDAAALAAWRESQRVWQEQRSLWVAEQRRSEHQARAAAARERSAQLAAANAERERIRRATRPRASVAVVGFIVGIAIVSAGAAALVSSRIANTMGHEWPIAIAIATTIVGLGAVVVGAARRRSGVLAALGIVGVVATLISAALPDDRRFVPLTSGYGFSTVESGRYAVLAGATHTWFSDFSARGGEAVLVDLWQAAGRHDVSVSDLEEKTIRILATVDEGEVGVAFDDAGEWTYAGVPAGQEGNVEVLVGHGEPDATLRLWLGEGRLLVNLYDVDPALVTIVSPAVLAEQLAQRTPEAAEGAEELSAADADDVSEPASAPADRAENQGARP